MTLFLSIFTSVLLPLMLVVGAAYLLGRQRKLDPGPLASTAYYILSPALVFVTMSTTSVTVDILGQLFLLKATVCLLLIVIVRVIGARLRLAPATISALILATAFANSGNFGLSVTEFAFGKEAVAFALVCYVTDNLLLNSIGVYLATRGRTTGKDAVLQMLRNPALYALPLGLAAHQIGWVPPLAVSRALEMLSRATVPIMLVVLGMQLAALPFDRNYWKLIGISAGLRLVFAPAVAILLTLPLGLTGVPRQVSVLEAAVPTAVMANIVASRHDVEPNLVAGSVLVTSLLSLATLTILLTLLR